MKLLISKSKRSQVQKNGTLKAEIKSCAARSGVKYSITYHRLRTGNTPEFAEIEIKGKANNIFKKCLHSEKGNDIQFLD